MKRKKRNRNPNLVRLRRSYTYAEIAEIYGVHIGTVQSWKKQGLKTLDETSIPHLIMGSEVRRFLKESKQKRKYPLKPGEFFCPKCRKPKKCLPEKITTEITNKRLGRYKQAIIRGVCEACVCRLFLFSSDRKCQNIAKPDIIKTEHMTTLIGSGDSSLNTGIKREENHET